MSLGGDSPSSDGAQGNLIHRLSRALSESTTLRDKAHGDSVYYT